jgi:hypothetical protein
MKMEWMGKAEEKLAGLELAGNSRPADEPYYGVGHMV